MPARGTLTGPAARQAGAVLLVLAIAVIGLRAGGSFSAAGSRGLLETIGQVLSWAIVVIGGVLALRELVAIVLWLLWARARGGRLPLRRRRSPWWWFMVLVLEVVALARIMAWLRRHEGAAQVQHRTAPSLRLGGWHGLLPPASSWPLLVALGIAAVAALALLMPGRRVISPDTPPGSGMPAAAPLAKALAAGAGALTDDPDPRAAIVGCYAAMEHSLAEAGAPPAAADTPAEVLARASAGGLVRSEATTTLTGLFRRARYSTHLMSEADRSAALGALTQLHADLADPRDRAGLAAQA